MSEHTFTPALGRLGPARYFDAVVALARDRLWRALTVMYLGPRPGEVILDVGCGTGTLAVLLSRVEPRARIIGVDPDPDVLAVAESKAGASGVDWRVGMGDALGESVEAESVDAIVSSLVLHQCPTAMKRAVLESAFRTLRPGGRLVITDYGRQRTKLMRAAFRIVQCADGKTDTQPNADGILPMLMSEAGFCDVHEADVVSTISGSISIYLARKN